MKKAKRKFLKEGSSPKVVEKEQITKCIKKKMRPNCYQKKMDLEH
jgi:hypothetical protein